MNDKIGEAVDGWGHMSATQTAFNQYTVVSWRNDSHNVYQVDVSAGTCTCEHGSYNEESTEACAHIMFAVFQGPARADTDEHMLRFLSEQVDDVQRAVDRIDQHATSMDAEVGANASQPASEPAENGHSATVEDPVERFEALLRDAGLDPDDFDCWVDSQFGSLQVDQDGYLSDDEFSTWVDMKDDLGMGYSSEDDVNYLQAEDFPEVLG